MTTFQRITGVALLLRKLPANDNQDAALETALDALQYQFTDAEAVND